MAQMLREFGFFQKTEVQVFNTHNKPIIQNSGSWFSIDTIKYIHIYAHTNNNDD